MTLIELMVALAVGSFLLVGAVTVFVQSQQSFRVNESVARLQEAARFVFDAIEPDLRMAHYWGLTTRSERIQIPAILPVVSNDCAAGWAVDITTEIGGDNNGYDWDSCSAAVGESATADTLVVRRAAQNETTGALNANMLYVQSARVEDGVLFQGPTPPTLTGTSQTHRLIVNGYYVSPSSSLSTAGNPVPSLRVKRLVAGAAGPVIEDQEVLPWVEDMQVQFGVDTDPPGAATRGSANIYVNPDAGILDDTSGSFNPDAQVISVRVWFRLRAERPEVGYTDTAEYVYADQDVGPFNDGFRRIVVSKTIFLRNARTAT